MTPINTKILRLGTKTTHKENKLEALKVTERKMTIQTDT